MLTGLKRIKFARTNETTFATSAGSPDPNIGYIYEDWTGGNIPTNNDVTTIHRGPNNYGASNVS